MNLTDKERRIFLAAMGRERDVCKKVDAGSGETPQGTSLVDICDSIVAKEKLDNTKYRWHDLRKNPDDLPNRKNKFLFSDDVIGYNGDYGVCYYDFMFGMWESYDTNFMAESVYVWKYIEPFEEDSDEL